MLNAAFVGIPSRLAKAYPAALRQEICAKVKIAAPDFSYENWREHQAALEQIEVIVATWGVPPLDAQFLALAKNLKAVFYAAGSVKGFVTPAAFARGIVVSSAQSANAIPVAEYVVGVVLLSLKRFWSQSRDLHRTGTWNRYPEVPGAYGSTVGFVSLGLTAKRAIEALSSFDLNLIGYDPFVSAEDAARIGVKLVSLEEVFRTSDVVSLHTPHLPETEHLVGQRLLALMKPDATLVNTSRGAVVAENELCGILKERPDLTAVLDVTDPEPPAPDCALLKLPNAVLTPHISGSLGREIERLGACMSKELDNYLSGRPLQFQVTADRLATMA